MENRLIGRVAGVFAFGSGYGNSGGGVEPTLPGLLANLVEQGVFVVPLPKSTPGYPQGGLHWGAYGLAHEDDPGPLEGGLPTERMEAVRHHGIHIARAALPLKDNAVFG